MKQQGVHASPRTLQFTGIWDFPFYLLKKKKKTPSSKLYFKDQNKIFEIVIVLEKQTSKQKNIALKFILWKNDLFLGRFRVQLFSKGTTSKHVLCQGRDGLSGQHAVISLWRSQCRATAF